MKYLKYYSINEDFWSLPDCELYMRTTKEELEKECNKKVSFDAHQFAWRKLSKLGYHTRSYNCYCIEVISYEKIIGAVDNLSGGVQINFFVAPDEWYYAIIYVSDDDILLYYKCDQIDGLLKLHQDIEDDFDLEKFLHGE